MIFEVSCRETRIRITKLFVTQAFSSTRKQFTENHRTIHLFAFSMVPSQYRQQTVRIEIEKVKK